MLGHWWHRCVREGSQSGKGQSEPIGAAALFVLNPQSHTSWGVSGLNRIAEDASQKLEAGSKDRKGMMKSAAQP